MSTIFCDNDGCMFSDGCGFCDCDKLSIVDGVCEGSYGRNASDDDERLKAENAKLRELLADTLIDPRDYCAKYGIDYDGWDSANDDIDRRLRELGIDVNA